MSRKIEVGNWVYRRTSVANKAAYQRPAGRANEGKAMTRIIPEIVRITMLFAALAVAKTVFEPPWTTFNIVSFFTAYVLLLVFIIGWEMTRARIERKNQ